MGSLGKFGGLRPCLICRRGGRKSFQDSESKMTRPSYSTSLCTIFGLPSDHPFKSIYERSIYCDPCYKEIQEADVALGKLELLRQSLLRFQNRIYSSLGENYFQIKDVDKRSASYEELERDAHVIKGSKFTYEDMVKVVYEKIDQESHLWERFSSEGQSSSIVTVTDDVGGWSAAFELPPGDISDMDDVDDDAPADCHMGDNELSEVQDPLLTQTSSSLPAAAGASISKPTRREQSSFRKPPTNFDESERRYCTYDKENCKRYFYDDYNLQVHIKSAHLGNAKPHECSLCQKSFADEELLNRHHMRAHSSSSVKAEPCICELCGKEFGDKHLLRSHIKRIHENSSYKCKLCSATLESSKALLEHEDLHSKKESPFACVFCPQILSHGSALRAHSMEHFPQLPTCRICSKRFANNRSLSTHMKSHDSSFAVFRCGQCAFTSTMQSGLNAHLMTHSTEKPFVCEECGASFKFTKNLNRHKRVHTQEKPYSCQICKASFRESEYLKRHEESHSVHPNYVCSACPKKFKVKEDFKKHFRRTHTEGYIKPKKRQPQGSPTSKKRTKVPKKSKINAEEETSNAVDSILVSFPVDTQNRNLTPPQ